MKITCPHCEADIDVIQEDQLLSCPSCGSRLHFLDETLLQTKDEHKVVAHFELIEQVGRGHFGDVWKARDVVLGRYVAVKIPRTGQLDHKTVQLFVREARAAAKLRHDNIVTVHEIFMDDKAVYIVSDLINGVTLAEQMRHKHRTPREAAELCATIAEALHYAHNNGVEAHRDVKPGNVMVDTSGKPFVMDFGLAKLDNADFTMTVAGQLLGTPAYMSPQQAKGVETDRRTDIYSLGVILYELLTHSRPFTGDTKLLLHQIVSEEPRAPRRINKSIPRPLDTICLKALSKEPERRYATAAEFAADLRRFLNNEPILAKPVSPLERGWRWAMRNPVVAGLGAAASVLLVMLAIVMSQRIGEWRAGFRDVSLTTDPPGAKVVFVPLDQYTRVPIEEQIVRPGQVTPLDLSLRPGPYLVVAVLPNGDFHEVYRFVSETTDEAGGVLNDTSWERRSDGAIVLPTITIVPTADAIRNMTLFTGGTFDMGSDTINSIPKHSRPVADFYLGQTEVTIGEYSRFGALPDELANRPPDEPVTLVSVDVARGYAELAGCRLMTEAEYEYAATQQGTRDFPWGDDTERVVPQIFQIQPVRQPDFDQTETNPPVYGLYSNATEWTDSLMMPYPGQGNGEVSASRKVTLEATRVVRGGPFTEKEHAAGDAVAPAVKQGARRRAGAMRSIQSPFVGFRCARSAKPRYMP